MNKITLALFLTVFISNSFGQVVKFYSDKYRVYTHEFNLELLYLNESKWTPRIIQEHLEEAAAVYAQCGVKLNTKQPQAIAGNPEVWFDLEGYSDDEDEIPEGSTLHYSAKYPAKEAIRVFFIHSFDPVYAKISATAVPPLRVTQADQKVALNSIWITNQIEYDRGFGPEEGGYPAGYNVLAHELGHVLMNTNHVNDYSVHNLMHESMYSLNSDLTLEQCEKIKTSKLVRPIDTSSAKTCPEIKSSLRSMIVFKFGSNESCEKAGSIINLLERVQDQVSDLSPVSGVDFYFDETGNLIQYQDRNILEGALLSSYDPYGRELLSDEQTDILWIHELGHAIFNAQFELDWKWYAEKMRLFKAWGEVIRESYNPNANDEEISNLVMERINAVKNYENLNVYEEVIAPYHELFADLVAVIYTQNPKALSEALLPPSVETARGLSELEWQAINERDFTIKHDIKVWSETDPHALLAPSRYFIWSEINKAIEKGRTKKEILRSSYKHISEEILSRVELLAGGELSVSQINQSLIKRFKLY